MSVISTTNLRGYLSLFAMALLFPQDCVEAEHGNDGSREFISLLRLLEKHSLSFKAPSQSIDPSRMDRQRHGWTVNASGKTAVSPPELTEISHTRFRGGPPLLTVTSAVMVLSVTSINEKTGAFPLPLRAMTDVPSSVGSKPNPAITTFFESPAVMELGLILSTVIVLGGFDSLATVTVTLLDPVHPATSTATAVIV